MHECDMCSLGHLLACRSIGAACDGLLVRAWAGPGEEMAILTVF